ncbi:hypothetical protein B0H14DRAFT_2592130 [Mycena olivaceomarginata]|nr:hypothetical protein B0H14DRAFT_2592130 [Mycena olivaceomarginata]
MGEVNGAEECSYLFDNMLFFKISGTSSRVMTMLSNAGVCVSSHMVEDLKVRIMDDAIRLAVELITSDQVFFTIFDNSNIFLRKSQIFTATVHHPLDRRWGTVRAAEEKNISDIGSVEVVHAGRVRVMTLLQCMQMFNEANFRFWAKKRVQKGGEIGFQVPCHSAAWGFSIPTTSISPRVRYSLNTIMVHAPEAVHAASLTPWLFATTRDQVCRILPSSGMLILHLHRTARCGGVRSIVHAGFAPHAAAYAVPTDGALAPWWAEKRMHGATLYYGMVLFFEARTWRGTVGVGAVRSMDSRCGGGARRRGALISVDVGGSVEDGAQGSGTRMDVHATAGGGMGTMGRCRCVHGAGSAACSSQRDTPPPPLS